MAERVQSTRDATRNAEQTVHHFGGMLREFRETYFERISQKHGVPNVKMHLTALALIECMREHGYPISSGAYSMVEAGATMPKDPKRFIVIVGTCLDLDMDQLRLLTEQVAHDILVAKLGDEVARRAFPHARRA
jgi:hypothetical protein